VKIDRRWITRILVICAANLGIWIFFGLYATSEFYRRTVDTGQYGETWHEVLMYQLSSSVMWAFFTPIAVFIAERLPLQKPHRMRNAVFLLAIAPVFSFLRSVIGAMAFLYGEGTEQNIPFIALSLSIRFHRNIWLFLIIVAVTNLVLLQRSAAERERTREALRTAVTNAELQRLRSSLQPRLMFATLDAIAANVTTRPEVADRMLVRLGDLLRTMLDFGRRRSVSLAEELEVIDRYFDIERERSGGTFTTRIDVEEELLAARVPPLLVHGLVETALHAGEKPAQHLDLRGRSGSGMLMLEIRHDAPDRKRTPAPAAVQEARSRLRQAFGDRASLQWWREQEQIVTELSIPLELEATA
jgi:two-component system, LytTR family, sensor kinase